MTADVYVQSVIDHLPRGLPLRSQIATELRSHIAERLAAGGTLADTLRQLGDPLTLAESYLAAVPLESASIPARIAAKAVDALAVLVIGITVVVGLWIVLPGEVAPFLPAVGILGCVLGFIAYTVVAEYRRGQTLGKRLMGIQVVRESGARISLGQALLRQLPFFAQFFFIDAVFAVFTDRRQRAFEILTKTRAIAILVCAVLLAPAIGASQRPGAEIGRLPGPPVDVGGGTLARQR